ncbi:MAG: hypothetical protein RLZ87_879, partial [Armatimonadota bacterium]
LSLSVNERFEVAIEELLKAASGQIGML